MMIGIAYSVFSKIWIPGSNGIPLFLQIKDEIIWVNLMRKKLEIKLDEKNIFFKKKWMR